MYYCKKCDKVFEKRRSYIGHCSSHNRGESYKKGRKKKEHRERVTECKYCGAHFDEGRRLGGHIANCKYNPNSENRRFKLSIAAKNRTFSEETKLKISKSRKRYLDLNPGKIPYLLNHSSKESYPERLFREKLERENIIGWIQEYPILRYSLDFAFLDKMINVEIDGGSHKLSEITKKDTTRDKTLTDLGWKVIRLRAEDIKINVDKEWLKVKSLL